MKEPKFKTFWLVDGLKINSYEIMRKRVLSGAIAIEVTAESQKLAADERKRQIRESAAKDAEIRRAAAQRAHERSPDGMREATIRTASRNPGGIVTGGADPFVDLEQFSPRKTNFLK